MNAPNVKLHPTAQPQVSAKRYAIILAGGSGTRLWPLSRSSKPKQLLCLNGAESLLQQTVRRTLPMVDAAHVCTVTAEEYRFEVAGQLLALDSALAEGVIGGVVAGATLAVPEPDRRVEVAGGDGDGAEQVAGAGEGDAPGEFQADDGIEEGLDGGAVGEGGGAGGWSAEHMVSLRCGIW